MRAAAVLLFLSAAFVLRRRARLLREAARRSPGISRPLSGVEAAARALYGESVGWDWDEMDTYDSCPDLREDWEWEAELRIFLRQLIR